jgi:hypothetical protein
MHYRFFALLLLSVILVGCNRQPPQPSDAEASASQTLIAPMPTAEILAALGPENNVPIHRLLPDPIFVITGKPKQFLASPICAEGELLVRDVIVQKLMPQSVQFRNMGDMRIRYIHGINLTDLVNPDNIEFFVQANGLERAKMCSMPNPQDPNAPPLQGLVPVFRQVSVITYSSPVNVSALLTAALDVEESVAAVIIDQMKQTVGKTEFYDLTPPNLPFPQRLALASLDERTLVLAEGAEEDIVAVFSDLPPRNAILDRLKHTPVADSELTIITSLEGPLTVSQEELQNMQLINVPQNIIALVNQCFRAGTLSLNLSAAAGQPIVSLSVEGRDEKSAESIAEAAQGLRINAQTIMATMSDEAKQIFAVPPDFAVALLNALSISVEGTRMNAVLNNFDTLIPTVAEGMRTGQIRMQQSQLLERQMQLQQWRMQQLRIHAELFSKYYSENQKFPSDILDANGKPLLSWRVAMLPSMGSQLAELYNKFKLDEPWDSEHNKELLDLVVDIYAPSSEEVEPTKSVIRFFDSPGMPFSNKNLKAEDIKFPQSTLMFVVVTPQYAVEWTKPDTLAFDFDKLAEIVGTPQFLGVTCVGEPLTISVVPDTEPQYETWKQSLEALIKGLPMPEMPQLEMPQAPQQ